jgi:hypothetical protein
MEIEIGGSWKARASSDKREVDCVENAACMLNSAGTFKICQCEAGRVCVEPDVYDVVKSGVGTTHRIWLHQIATIIFTLISAQN